MHNSTPAEVERLALSAMKTADAVQWALKRGLAVEAFQTEAGAAVWSLLRERALSGSPLPGPDDMRALGLEPADGARDFQTYVEELVRAGVASRARASLMTRVQKLDEDPEGTVRAIAADMAGLSIGTDLHVGMSDRDAADRLVLIRERVEAKSAGRSLGIPTGLPVFDDIGGEWRPGEVATVMGATGSGKSFMLVYWCCVAYAAGRRVLLLSPENTKTDMEWRVDVILSRLDSEDWGLTLDGLRMGTIDVAAYERWLDRFGLRDDWITVDSGEGGGAFTADDVVALAREHRPDILALDGFHLLAGKGKSWEVMFEAGKRIKGLAQGLGIPILCATQATREASVIQEDTPELSQAAYGYAIMEDSNRVVGMARQRGNKGRRIFRVTKWRDGPDVTQRQYLSFDVNRGLIRQVTAREGADGQVDFV